MHHFYRVPIDAYFSPCDSSSHTCLETNKTCYLETCSNVAFLLSNVVYSLLFTLTTLYNNNFEGMLSPLGNCLDAASRPPHPILAQTFPFPCIIHSLSHWRSTCSFSSPLYPVRLCLPGFPFTLTNNELSVIITDLAGFFKSKQFMKSVLLLTFKWY